MKLFSKSKTNRSFYKIANYIIDFMEKLQKCSHYKNKINFWIQKETQFKQIVCLRELFHIVTLFFIRNLKFSLKDKIIRRKLIKINK
jgi:hypothetical protein